MHRPKMNTLTQRLPLVVTLTAAAVLAACASAPTSNAALSAASGRCSATTERALPAPPGPPRCLELLAAAPAAPRAEGAGVDPWDICRGEGRSGGASPTAALSCSNSGAHWPPGRPTIS